LGELFAIDCDKEVDLNAINDEGVDWIILAQDMLQWLALCVLLYPFVSYGM
jgi:hypothetical protein